MAHYVIDKTTLTTNTDRAPKITIGNVLQYAIYCSALAWHFRIMVLDGKKCTISAQYTNCIVECFSGNEADRRIAAR